MENFVTFMLSWKPKRTGKINFACLSKQRGKINQP